ncbi:MAG: GH36-type glycosyl hydrolase domain-containing protein [Geminicoccaceae bacterium]
MTPPAVCTLETPGERDLGLRTIANQAGLSISVLPNGCVFAIAHRHERGRTMINQVQGSPLDGGIARLYLRIRAPEPLVAEAVGPGAKVGFSVGDDRFAWDGATGGVRHLVTLWLHPRHNLWLWRLEVANRRAVEVTCDAILVQDVGLGDRGFVMNNEAYASQYIDHHVALHPHCGPVVMSRQNLAQSGGHPWVAHGCLDGAASFATDAMQLLGPRYRDAALIDPGTDLPGARLQHELACPMIQSRAVTLKPGAQAAWTFFGLYEPDHAEASSDADLWRIDQARASADFPAGPEARCEPERSLLQDAPPVVAHPLGAAAIAERYPERAHEERAGGGLVSFFTPDAAHNRHVVLGAKERMVARRHGTILRTGQGMLPGETTLCATCWMHGVFAAQLTIGNTSFHKLFSVARDPYNITRSSGLRILIEAGAGWRLLAVPSAFEIGLSDCRWIYRLDERTVTVRALASGDDPALQWRIAVEGAPCRLLVFGHLVLGERELDHAGRIEIDAAGKRFTFRPDPSSLWGQRYPDAVYHLVTSTPGAIETLGGDELLYGDGRSRGGAYVALRTRATDELRFAIVGSMTDPQAAERLAAKYARGVDDATMLAPAARYWEQVTRGLRITGGSPDVAALDTILPWLAHNAMVHLSVPHGLEQYTGAAWGTRDVCQGPVEFLLALEHDLPVKEILRIVFAQQYEARGDWSQWFMLEPYAAIRDAHSHGDVIVWPLKALCDYVEATNDLGFLDEPIAWRREDDFEPTARKDPVAAHVDKLLATVRERFIPGTHLIRYGEGDWNDSLQPADPKLRDRMVSSWTVALLFQQLNRYAEVLRRAGRSAEAKPLSALAAAMREDFNHHLVPAGTVAGYALFGPDRAAPELLLHPSDTRTGLSYSLLPMTRSIIAGLFTREQAQHHLRLIREHLLFPDGVRLMDRPVRYHGGLERLFRRAESSAFFGREIGLMYVHAHLRYGEALAAQGEADALWEALQLVSPIAVTERLAHASPRQRNAYFSSSDAAFCDRYQASAEWPRVKAGAVAVDGGWRIYSSGPGLYTNLLLRHALGIRRHFGERIVEPLLPRWLGPLTLEMVVDGQRHRWILSAT